MSVDEIRAVLHKKAHSHFSMKEHVAGRIKRQKYFAALDTLLETSEAATSYESVMQNNPSAGLLIANGFLQVLYAQQDAVIVLCKMFTVDWRADDDKIIGPIRDYRNRIVGHPSGARVNKKLGKPATQAYFSFTEFTEKTFVAILHGDDQYHERVEVNIDKWLLDQDNALSIILEKILEVVNQEEKDFLKKISQTKLADNFTQYTYLFEIIFSGFGGSAPDKLTAAAHISMLKNQLDKYVNELIDEKIVSEIPASVASQAIALDWLKDYFSNKVDNQTSDGNELAYVLATGIQTLMKETVNSAIEYDIEFEKALQSNLA